MKQKPDETLDQWVRQALSQLPDAPPPASSFDSEHLWAQLRPELQAEPSRWPARLVWWMAAACLAGLSLGWVWLYRSTDDRNTVNRKNNRKTEVPIVSVVA